MQPKISVVIPAFNEAEYLPGCLQSIKEVNYPQNLLEVIVIDNGSTDATRQIAKAFGVSVFCEPAKSVGALRNLGVRHANGQILAFLDADCCVHNEWLKHAEQYFDQSDIVAWGAPPTPPENPTWVQRTWFLVR